MLVSQKFPWHCRPQLATQGMWQKTFFLENNVPLQVPNTSNPSTPNFVNKIGCNKKRLTIPVWSKGNIKAKRKYFSTHNPYMVNFFVYENNVLIHSTSFRVIEFNVLKYCCWLLLDFHKSYLILVQLCEGNTLHSLQPQYLASYATNNKQKDKIRKQHLIQICEVIPQKVFFKMPKTFSTTTMSLLLFSLVDQFHNKCGAHLFWVVSWFRW